MTRSIESDVKAIYAQNKGKTDIVGVSIAFNEPKKPDLVLETDKLSICETVTRILEHLRSKYGANAFEEL